jgi:adenylate kinase family enzyme
MPLGWVKIDKEGKLDKPETIRVRLKEYKERTLPVIEYLKKRKIKVDKINGSPPPAIVFENILKKLK